MLSQAKILLRKAKTHIFPTLNICKYLRLGKKVRKNKRNSPLIHHPQHIQQLFFLSSCNRQLMTANLDQQLLVSYPEFPDAT